MPQEIGPKPYISGVRQGGIAGSTVLPEGNFSQVTPEQLLTLQQGLNIPTPALQENYQPSGMVDLPFNDPNMNDKLSQLQTLITALSSTNALKSGK